MKIAITTAATDNYLYAVDSLLQAIAQNVFEAATRRPDIEILLIMVGNKSILKHKDMVTDLGLNTKVGNALCHTHWETCEEWRETKKYSESQNLMVAQMRGKAMNVARRENADYLWFLDADVIPQPNSLLCSLQMLEFDNGWYDVAFCPYPSQGGGSYLGGFGSPQSPIYPDFRPDEREVPDDLKEEFMAATLAFETTPSQETFDEMSRLRKRIERECPPLHGGDIMKHNAEFGWRQRGWYDYAYPGIGLGSVVPTVWWGFGCTLLSRKALSFSDFVGYTGKGTEDLFVVYKKFWARGYRSCLLAHCPAGHVIRRGEKREIIHCHAHHETSNAETMGHLRRSYLPYYSHVPGEEYKTEASYQKLHIDEAEANVRQAADFQGD